MLRDFGILGVVGDTLLWSLIATAALTVILQGSQNMGLSRLSIPFLVGTVFTGNRDRAVLVGFVVYTIGGWLFAIGYHLVFLSVGWATWWLGALLGLLHAAVLLVSVLPVLPHIHPRMASEYAGPTVLRRLEPPGFLGLNYGRETPICTVASHVVFGAILGAFAGAG